MIKVNRILLLCFLVFYSAAFSQEKENPFSASENGTYTSSQKTKNRFATADHEPYDDAQNSTNGTGPPSGEDDSIPIDNYIPILVVVAVTIIGYMGKKNKPWKLDFFKNHKKELPTQLFFLEVNPLEPLFQLSVLHNNH